MTNTIIGLLSLLSIVTLCESQYQVAIEVKIASPNTNANIQLVGIFGKTNTKSIDDIFDSVGLKEPFTVDAARDMGEILEFIITPTTTICCPITTPVISKVQIKYRYKTREWSGDLLLQITPITEALLTPYFTAYYVEDGNNIKLPNEGATRSITAGESITFKAIAITNDTESETKYQWYSQPNEFIQEKLISNGTTLIITNALPADASSYYCVMSVEDSVVKSTTVEVIVDYLTIKPFSIQLHDNTYIAEGSPVEIGCEASTNQINPQYKWLNNTTEVSNSMVLQFSSISRDDSGEYTCEVIKNDSPFKERKTIKVMVNYLDPPIVKIGNTSVSTDAQNLSFASGPALQILCLTSGYPTDFQYILRSGNELLSTTNQHSVSSPLSGYYSCEVSNLYFAQTRSVYVNITSEPPIPGKENKNDFWTTELIIIFAIAVGFLIIIVWLIVCVCWLFKKGNKNSNDDITYRSSGRVENSLKSNSPQVGYYRAHENVFLDDTEGHSTRRENLKQNRPISASSAEYKTSNGSSPNVRSKSDKRINQSNSDNQMTGQKDILESSGLKNATSSNVPGKQQADGKLNDPPKKRRSRKNERKSKLSKDIEILQDKSGYGAGPSSEEEDTEPSSGPPTKYYIMDVEYC